MNGFSTEEDSHDGPPAPPFYGQSCCLIEDGERCGRSAGNASFSKRIQKSISQKKLKLDIDKSVRHLYICDFHKNFIQSVRNKRKRKTSDDGGESPDHDVEVPEVSGVKNQSTAPRHLTCAVAALLLNVASFQHEHTTVTDPGFDSVHLCGVPCSYHDAYYWK
ncbi:Histone deacetylase complex subunit sap30l [Ameca splendens]|uniref:Histone deacetylase complex subunit sap30l n=1 Tax=Ameca splendens TaxID=208324 RepID=A0ABV0XJF9_9TELE